MNWLSEIVWATLFVLALGWEIFTVATEKKYRHEPLTRVYRDKLMRSKFGIVFRLIFIAFMGWLLLHWLLPLEW